MGKMEAKLEAKWEADIAYPGRRTNSAFVFIKPKAVTPKAKALLESSLVANGITVLKSGELSAKTIDKEMLIDNHYGAIASKAVKLQPSELNVSQKAQDAFKDAFGLEWSEAVASGKVYNAVDGCKKLGVNPKDMEAKYWSKLTKGKDLIKFGGGFYCGKVGEDTYVINGFYMSMRSVFTTPPAKIVWYSVEWPAASLSWEDFRGKVLGGTDPREAEPGSARREILENWKALGLKEEPNVGDNGVHASASLFEALAERMNWLGGPRAAASGARCRARGGQGHHHGLDAGPVGALEGKDQPLRPPRGRGPAPASKRPPSSHPRRPFIIFVISPRPGGCIDWGLLVRFTAFLVTRSVIKILT